jgi:hypothetical protein
MDEEWIVGRWNNLGYAVRGDVLTVAVLAPGNNGPKGPPRISLRLCPTKLHELRRRSLPPPAVDPIVEAVCGLKVPPGRYHVFLFHTGEPCAT